MYRLRLNEKTGRQKKGEQEEDRGNSLTVACGERRTNIVTPRMCVSKVTQKNNIDRFLWIFCVTYTNQTSRIHKAV